MNRVIDVETPVNASMWLVVDVAHPQTEGLIQQASEFLVSRPALCLAT